jgi:hypothetical protein
MGLGNLHTIFSGERKRDYLGERGGDGNVLTVSLRSRIRFVHRIDLA